MNLPRLMVVTEYSLMRPSFEAALEAALRGGARLFQLRQKDADDEEVLSLAHAAQKLCKEYGAGLLINNNLVVATQCGAKGVHLPAHESVSKARISLGPEYSVGQSVHALDSAREAQTQGADYLIFGSVFHTESHPQSTPAGLSALTKVCASVTIPVYAIGGVNSSNAPLCLEAGAHGVAVIRSAWDAPEVEQAVRALYESVSA